MRVYKKILQHQWSSNFQTSVVREWERQRREEKSNFATDGKSVSRENRKNQNSQQEKSASCHSGNCWRGLWDTGDCLLHFSFHRKAPRNNWRWANREKLQELSILSLRQIYMFTCQIFLMMNSPKWILFRRLQSFPFEVHSTIVWVASNKRLLDGTALHIKAPLLHFRFFAFCDAQNIRNYQNTAYWKVKNKSTKFKCPLRCL